MPDERIPPQQTTSSETPQSSPPPATPPLAADLQTLAALAPVARQSVVDAVADRLRGEILFLHTLKSTFRGSRFLTDEEIK